MNSNTVSIIIPTYNRAYILDRAIYSVLRQTFKKWELIIIDDGSSDSTEKLVLGLSKKNVNIKYYHQNNKGPSIARNLGLQKSSGQYIAYLDSDNEFLPNYLETMLQHFKSNPVAVFSIPKLNYTLEKYTNNTLVESLDYSDNIPNSASVNDIINRTFHFDTNGLMHKRIVVDYKIAWNPKVKVMEDWEFALSLCEAYPSGFMLVPIKLANYKQRYGMDGLVGKNSYQDIANGFEAIYQLHKSDKLMQNQQWYPARIKKWSNLQKQFELGKIPPHSEYYFSELYTQANSK